VRTSSETCLPATENFVYWPVPDFQTSVRADKVTSVPNTYGVEIQTALTKYVTWNKSV
jgi:hypothetical protein